MITVVMVFTKHNTNYCMLAKKNIHICKSAPLLDGSVVGLSRQKKEDKAKYTKLSKTETKRNAFGMGPPSRRLVQIICPSLRETGYKCDFMHVLDIVSALSARALRTTRMATSGLGAVPPLAISVPRVSPVSNAASPYSPYQPPC